MVKAPETCVYILGRLVMKIEGATPSTGWPDVAGAEQPVRKEKASVPGKSGADSEGSEQEFLDPRKIASSSGVYSSASLKVTAARNALYPQVAENNIYAVHHSAPIPRFLIDRLRAKA
jgi:hypothetical protein